MTKIRKALFNRTTMMLIAILIELLLLAGLVKWLGGVAGWISGGLRILSIFLVLNIVRTSRHLSSDLMWIILIMLFPVMGTAFFLFVGTNLVISREAWRIVKATKDSEEYYARDEKTLKEAEKEYPQYRGQMEYLSGYAHFPVYENGEGNFDYYPLGDDGFPAMLEAMKGAKKFIFLEYFIIAKGEMWDRMHGILKDKAAEGLDVRVMYDDMGSFRTLPMSYSKKLQAEGIRCIPFNRISPVLGAVMNHRDHRKILVVDGKTAFSGGINLADEYINQIVRFGHWKDNVIRIQGKAVWSYTVMFLTHWKALSGQEEDFEKFRGDSEKPGEKSHSGNMSVPDGCIIPDGYIIPYGDTPLDEKHVGQDVYMNILNAAERYCYIMTPYLILDNEFVNALVLAASRGVDVRIITPGIPDKKTVFGVTRSFYEVLLQGGVRIYEYTPGFVHAKIFVSDDTIATVGTINLDYRSLYLHFENGTCLIGSSKVADVRDDVEKTLQECREVSLPEAKFNFFVNTKNSVIRIFAGQL